MASAGSPEVGDLPEAVEVSFIVPTYNCLALTKDFLRSFLATETDISAPHELIFVDDGSTDGTREWLEQQRSSTIRSLLRERNGGYAAANNHAIAASRGGVLALLNNDLLLAPGWFSPMRRALDIPSAGIVGNVQFSIATGAVDHAGICIDAKGRPAHVRTLAPFAPAVTEWPAVTGACCLIQRDVWDAVGGFDEGFQNGGEDVDLCLRLRARGLRCLVATRSQIQHHVSASPNRKLRDEANSARLAARWREEFVRLGVRERVRLMADFEIDAASAFEDPSEALHLVAHRLHLTALAPGSAVRALELAIEQQEARWHSMGL